MDSKPQFDVCVIGAGVAGAAIAGYLGKQGRKVVVIEKSLAEMDRILGELLQPGGVQMLKKLGLESTLENIDAQPVVGYGMFLNGESFQIGYPVREKGLTGFGFRNGRFVQNLRQVLHEEPNITVIEATVNSFIEEKGTIKGVHYTEDGVEKQMLAPLTIACDGAFSPFREKLTDGEKKITGYFLGLIMEDCNLPYPGHGHVLMTDHAPALLYPITKTGTRALIDFPGDQPPRKGDELKKHLLEAFGPYVPESAKPSFINAVNDGKFKVFPNHRLPADPVLKKGVVLLGDSLNMRHPLTGGGMTAAFSDAYNLGNCLLQVKHWWNTHEIELAVKAFYDTKHDTTATINILADALYGVMRNHDLRDACYDYLIQGGKKASEPVSILSALSRNKELLQRHFFAVAFHGARNIMKDKSKGSRLKRSVRMVKDAVKIITPLLMSEKPSWGMRNLLRAGRVVIR